MKNCSIIVSILNWNTAAMTATCVASVLAMRKGPDVDLQVVVIDNGSAETDWMTLTQLVTDPAVKLIRQPDNLGFAGGHNVAIRMALEQDAGFIWLVNSDSLLERETLMQLLDVMRSDPACGSVSPVVTALHNENAIDFCGAQHDWPALDSVRAGSVAQARAMEAANGKEMWLAGTVVMFRMTALRAVGLLNEKLFAYFEDDDIGVRLIKAGWSNRMAFEARARHAQPDVKERPAHYFYLMNRNALLFYLAHTPVQFRRLIHYRLLDRAVFTANRLRRKGKNDLARACLLGAMDGLRGHGGRPDLARQPALWLRILCKVLLLKQYRLILKVEP